MKKAEQIAINEEVMDALELVTDKCTIVRSRERLYNCQAWMCDIIAVKSGAVIGTALMSYDTVVAYSIDGIVYDFLRYVYGYTATSAQHISKFAKYTGADKALCYKPV